MSSYKRLIPLLATVILLITVTFAQAGPVTKVYYVDAEDRYSATAGVSPCLKKLGISASSGFPGALKPGESALLIIGSLYDSPPGKKARNPLPGKKDAIAKFVNSGGVVLVLGQTAEADADVTWLPAPLTARRSERDTMEAKVVSADHPLMSTPNRLKGADLIPGEVIRKRGSDGSSLAGGSDLFQSASGFVVLAADPGPDGYPLVMVGRVGKGAVILTATSPDKACAFGPKAEHDAAATKLLFENAIAFAANVSDAGAPTDYSAAPVARKVTVFADLDRDGRRGAAEKGIPGVEVLYGYNAFSTDAEGVARISISAQDLLPLSVALADGYRASTPVYLDALTSGDFEVGFAPMQSSNTDTRTIYLITDVHIGSDEPMKHAEHLNRFMRQLQGTGGEDDLFLFTGDLTQRAHLDEHMGFKTAFDMVDRPKIAVIGNHDAGDGPDMGRFYEYALGPQYYSMDWRGYRFISLPVLAGDGPDAQWVSERINSSDKPVWIATHKFPARKVFDALPAGKVAGVMSGHWHGDMVTKRKDMLNVNLSTGIFGSWDFSPGSARRMVMEADGTFTSQLLPYVQYPVAAILVSGSRTFVTATIPVDLPEPECTGGGKNLKLDRLGPNAWEVDGKVEWPVACTAGGQPLKMFCDPMSGKEATDLSCAGPTVKGTRLNWASQLPGRSLMDSPLVSGDSIYFTLRNSYGAGTYGGVCRLNTADGGDRACAWTPAQVATPAALAGGTIVVTEITGDRHGYDPVSLEERWSKSLDESISPKWLHHYVYSPPVRDGSKLYYCYQSAPYAIDARSGELVWRASDGFDGADHFGFSKGVIHEGYLYCSAYLGGLSRYDIKRDNAKRELIYDSAATCSDLIEMENRLWVLTRSKLLGFDFGVVGAPAKKAGLQGFILPADPVPMGKSALVPVSSSAVGIVDLESGKRQWSFSLRAGPMSFETNEHVSAGVIGTPGLLSGRVVIPGSDGTLWLVNSGKASAAAWVGVPLVSDVAVSGKSIVAVDYGGMVYSFSAE